MSTLTLAQALPLCFGILAATLTLWRLLSYFEKRKNGNSDNPGSNPGNSMVRESLCKTRTGAIEKEIKATQTLFTSKIEATNRLFTAKIDATQELFKTQLNSVNSSIEVLCKKIDNK